jgi:hypothetical protein
LELAQELKGQWKEERDRKNWVLPPVDSSSRGDYKVIGYTKGMEHPGEGEGRARVMELCVEEEMGVW